MWGCTLVDINCLGSTLVYFWSQIPRCLSDQAPLVIGTPPRSRINGPDPSGMPKIDGKHVDMWDMSADKLKGSWKHLLLEASRLWRWEWMFCTNAREITRHERVPCVCAHTDVVYLNATSLHALLNNKALCGTWATQWKPHLLTHKAVHMGCK